MQPFPFDLNLVRQLLAALLIVSLAETASAQGNPQRTAEQQQPATSIAARTTGLEKLDGFIPLYVDSKSGKLLAELPRDGARALFWTMLATGLGSNPVGLDRGASGDEQVVRFDHEGDRVLMVFENNAFRTSLDDPAHRRSIEESFPASTVAALPLVAAEGGRLLVDLTDVAYRDWNDVAGTLARSNQGSYSVARDRSYIDRAHTAAHPGNSEIDVALTFTASARPGSIVSRITPDGRAFTLRQHLTLLPLPVGYEPRAMDPRVGYFGVTFKDYGQPIQRALEQRWVSRHRLSA